PKTEEIERLFENVDEPGELFDVPARVVSKPTSVIRMVSPDGREYDINFSGYSTERRDFDKYLAERAVKAGAELMTDTKFMKFDGRNRVVTTRGTFDAKIVVGADGPFSAVRRSIGLPAPRLLYPAMSTTMNGEFGDTVYMYFGSVAPAGYAWIIPKAGGANVGLGADPALTKREVGFYAKEFIKQTGMKFNTKPRQMIAGGWVPMAGPLSKTVDGNVLLVGDAAGHVMATNGGGICTAMICGRIAGRTIGDHLNGRAPLEKYELEWRRAIGRDLETAKRMVRYASFTFSNDWMLSLLFRFAGRKGLSKVIKCKSIFSLRDWT
ncbi:MAG: FAD-dependent monooxygenase, partial [Thermoplasmata archaeon]|nr:FAD-dependent monooxygenase [Candidatus Sysuiplasma superficiale]